MPIINPTLREMRQELSVDEEFVNRYNRPGPRYTSYPTAPVWTDSFGPNEYETAIALADQKHSQFPCTCTCPSVRACACFAHAT